MANLSKASNVVQEKYILYDVTGFTQKWHSIPVATNCNGKKLYQDTTVAEGGGAHVDRDAGCPRSRQAE